MVRAARQLSETEVYRTLSTTPGRTPERGRTGEVDKGNVPLSIPLSINGLYERYRREKGVRLVTAAEMKSLDADAIERVGIPSLVLMERAALAVVERLESGDFDLTRVACVCGMGNNGGDGIAVTRLLSLAGHEALAILVGDERRMSADARIQRTIAENLGVRMARHETGLLKKQEATTIVDALFGVGLERPLEGPFAQIVAEINACTSRGALNTEGVGGTGGARGVEGVGGARDACGVGRAGAPRVLAVDIPSGISSDTGAVLGVAVCADATVTFAYGKHGLALEPGKTHAGEVLIADIGIYAL